MIVGSDVELHFFGFLGCCLGSLLSLLGALLGALPNRCPSLIMESIFRSQLFKKKLFLSNGNVLFPYTKDYSPLTTSDRNIEFRSFSVRSLKFKV